MKSSSILLGKRFILIGVIIAFVSDIVVKLVRSCSVVVVQVLKLKLSATVLS